MMGRQSATVRLALEWTALILFLAAPIGSSVLFGGVKLWMSGPFILVWKTLSYSPSKMTATMFGKRIMISLYPRKQKRSSMKKV